MGAPEQSGKNEIHIVAPKHLGGGKLFVSDSSLRSYEVSRPWARLREVLGGMGFEVRTADAVPDESRTFAVVFFEVPESTNSFYRSCINSGLRDRLFLLVNEPRVIHPKNHDPAFHRNFKGVMTWNTALVDNRKYFRMNFTIPLLEGEKIEIPRAPFGEKKLLCLISANKYSHRENELYSERVRAIRFMERNHPQDFDLYGIGWEQPIICSPIASILPVNAAIQKFYPGFPFLPKFHSFPSYRGTVKDKKSVLPKYRFSLTYENEEGMHGYISEKMLECMLCGCVPVYLGDPDVLEMVPGGCFVDKRDYPDYLGLYGRLSSISEKEHTEYLDSIESFLNGEKARPFKIDAFVESFMKALGIAPPKGESGH